MKTTIEIADPLLRKAKQRAARDGTTLRDLVERGLQTVLSESAPRKKFRLKIKPFKGEGLQPGIKSLHWDDIGHLVYDEEERFR